MDTCQEEPFLRQMIKTIVFINFMHTPGRKNDYQNISGPANIYWLINRLQGPCLFVL